MQQRHKLIIEFGLFAYNHIRGILLFRIYRCESPLRSVAAVKPELIEIGIITHIAKFAQRIIIPDDAIIVIGNDEGYRYFGIILEQGLIFALVIKIVGLMLSQTVEGLIIG